MSLGFPPQISAMQELHEAIDEVNDFYLEKHGRVSAAAVKAAEDKRVRFDKAEQNRQKILALNVFLRQLRAEGDRRMRKRFFDLFRQGYLAVNREMERARKSKERARFPSENYCPDVEEGRVGPSSESGRGSERSGSTNSFAINVAHGASARALHSDASTPSITSSPTLPWTPISTSPDVPVPDLDPFRNPATRLNPLANPFPDPSLRIQTQPPNPRDLALPPLPVPGPVPGSSRHGPSDNTAPQLPPAVYNASAQLQERLRGASLGPVRAVPSQIEYDQQWQTRHQGMREYELQRAKGRI